MYEPSREPNHEPADPELAPKPDPIVEDDEEIMFETFDTDEVY